MAATDAYDPNATATDSTGAAKTPGSQIAAWYQQYLGRAPESQDVVNAWAGQDPTTAQQGIENSPEAQAYAASQAGGGTAQTLPTMSATPTSTAPTVPTGSAPYNTSADLAASVPATNPALTQLRSLLMGYAGQSPTVDPNDPSISAATNAYSADATRAGRSFLSGQAESQGPNANLDAATRSTGEKVGQATADYRANLVNTMNTQRQQQIQQALSGLGGTLSTDEQTQLAQELLTLQQQQKNSNDTQNAFQDNYQTIFG